MEGTNQKCEKKKFNRNLFSSFFNLSSSKFHRSQQLNYKKI